MLKPMLVNKDFPTWHLIVMASASQADDNRFENPCFLTNMDFSMEIS